jgi:hypothetical protein
MAPPSPAPGSHGHAALAVTRRDHLEVAGVMLLVLLVNLVSLRMTGFDGLYGQDPFAYFEHAVDIANRWTVFHQWRFEERPRLLAWPVGYPAILAGLFRLLWPTPVLGQAVSLLAWAGSAGLVVAVGRRLVGRQAALLAGVLFAFVPWGRKLAVSVMSDATTTVLTLAAVWLGLRARETVRAAGPGARAGLLLCTAGLLFGLSGTVRHLSLTTMPLLVVLAFRPRGLEQPTPRRWLPWVALACLVAGLGYLPQWIVNHLHPSQFWEHTWMTRWSPWHAFRTEFETGDGYARYTVPPLLFFVGQVFVSPRLLTPVGLPLCALGAWVLCRRRRERADGAAETLGVAGLLLVTWWLLPAFGLSLVPNENERYATIYLAPMVWGAALGAVEGLRLAAGSPRLRQAMLAFGVLALAGFYAISERHLRRFTGDKARELSIARTLEARVPRGAQVLTFGLSPLLDHYTRLRLKELATLTPGRIAELAAEPGTYLFADPAFIERVFARHPIGERFRAARARAVEPEVAEIGGYRLWMLR